VYTTSNWSTMSDIKDLAASKLFFGNFGPFIAGKLWLSGVKVGSFVDQDTLETPSPLDSGSQGSALKFVPLGSDSTKIVLKTRNFDANYYKSAILTPEFVEYFFSDTLSKLTASNDETVLKNTVKATGFVRRAFFGEDTVLQVPKEVRLGPDIPIYVKMLHFRKNQQAVVQSSAAIATVKGVPSFPINDLTIKLDPEPASNFLGKWASITVTRGSEGIDSVWVVVATEGGQAIDTVSKPASGPSLNFTIDVPKGTFVFYAVPVARIGSVTKPGSATKSTQATAFGLTKSDTVFVAYKTGGCTGADGSSSNAYCSLDSALKDIGVRKGGIILIKKSTPVVPMEDIIIGGAETDPVTIITNQSTGKYDENRPIFRGKAREALTITRQNVTLKGFFIEMPASSTTTAMNIKGSGALVEGNIFRASTKAPVEGLAVNIDVGASGEVRFVNNLLWGFTKNVQVTNPSSANIRVINNTFVDDPGLSNTGKTTGIQLASAGTTATVFANNFFSGIATPIDVSVQTPFLDHNVYTGKPNLRNSTDAGSLDSSARIPTSDIWAANYVGILEGALAQPIECSSISPCNPLYAGSASTAGYNTTIDHDVLGKGRSNKHEVGAYELPASTSGINGALSISVSRTADYTRINWAVTGKTFDPAEVDSVFVLWSTTDLTTTITESTLGTIPATRQKHFPIGSLSSGNLVDVASDIKEENQLFHFYAVLERTNASKTRTLGYAYSDTITSGINFLPGDCQITTTKSACPSDVGVFSNTQEPWTGLHTRVKFAEAVASGIVKNPEFITIQNSKVFNLDIVSPLPMIKLNASLPGLGAAGSKQTITADIEMDFHPDLSGLELFLLPSDSSGMAQFVPTWSIKEVGSKTHILIESNLSGGQSYAFGKMQSSVLPASIVSTNTATPVFDLTTTKDSAFVHVGMKFKGAGFRTSNPLVLVSVIPAGGTVTGTGGTVVDVMSGSYHSKTAVLSAGFSNLVDTLQQDRLYRYFKKAAAYEGVSSMGMGHKKPFLLDTNETFANFVSATDIQSSDISVVTGNMGEITLNFPISRKFNDFTKYPDQIGKTTRSIEVEYTVFDGDRISRSRAFIRTKFADGDIHITERKKNGYERAAPGAPVWNLFGYPWDELDSGSLARVVDKHAWDHDNMRLMKYKGTGKGAESFYVYDGTNPENIKYDSGQAAWSGSTAPYTPSSISGMSLDFTTFKLPLAPNQWNDVALPFNFPIKWIDVLDSSLIAPASAPAAWHFNVATHGFEKVEAGSVSPPVATTILTPWEGYTIRPTSAVTLSFPILDADRSLTAVAKVAAKAAANSGTAPDESWTARVLASNGSASMYLRIGKGNAEALYPEAPDAPGQDFRVALKYAHPAGEEMVSQFIQSMDGISQDVPQGNWEGNWALKASTAKGANGISLRIADASREVPIYLVETLHKTAIPLSADAPIKLSESDLAANDYHLVAGGKDYLDAVLNGLVPMHMLALSNSPNPFAGATLIRYALPESFGKVSFDLKVRDFRGRTIWEKTIKGGNSLSYLWDGRDKMNSPLPAGVYQLSLEATAPGKPLFKANRRMLRM